MVWSRCRRAGDAVLFLSAAALTSLRSVRCRPHRLGLPPDAGRERHAQGAWRTGTGHDLLRRALPLLALLWLAVSCRSEPAPPGLTASTTAPRPAVPAPAELVGEVRIARPEASWPGLRAAVGGPLQYLPRGVTGMLLTVLGLPIGAAGEIDVDRPIVGTVGIAAPGSAGAATPVPDLAFAVALRGGRRFVAQLTVGPDARLQASTEPGSELTWLGRRAGDDASRWLPGWELAVLDDTLLAGSSHAALAVMGPYLARTLAPRAREAWSRAPEPAGAPDGATLPEPDLLLVLAAGAPRQALLGSVRSWLDASGLGQMPRLRALGEPSELRTAAESAVDAVAELSVAVRLGERSSTLDARLRLRAETRERLTSFGLAPPGQLLQLPADAMLAASWAEPRDARIGSAAAAAQRVAALLGPKGPAEVEPVLRDGLGELARARGDLILAGLRCSGVGLTGFARSSIEDVKRARHGLESLTKLRRNPTVVGRLDEVGLRIGLRTLRLPDLPFDVTDLRLSHPARPAGADASADAGHEGAAAATPEPVELLAAVGEHELWLAGGMDARATLTELYQTRERSTSTETTILSEATSRLGERAWLAILVRPLALLSCGTATPEPEQNALLVAALGPTGSPEGVEARLHVEATTALLRAAAERWDAVQARGGGR